MSQRDRISQVLFNQAKAAAESALSAFVAAAIGFLKLDPRRASLQFDIGVEKDVLDAEATMVYPEDVEVSIYYTTHGEPEDADRPASQN